MSDLGNDLYSCSVMILAGVGLGFFFDLHRSARRIGQVKGAVSFFLDLGYGLLAGVWVTGALVVANWGEIRWYTLAAAALGAWTYFYLGSPLMQLALGALERGCRRFLGARRRKPPP